MSVRKCCGISLYKGGREVEAMTIFTDQDRERVTIPQQEEEGEEEGEWGGGSTTCLSSWKRKNRTSRRRSLLQSEFSQGSEALESYLV